MLSTATQTPTRVKMALLDQAADACLTEAVGSRLDKMRSVGEAWPFNGSSSRKIRYANEQTAITAMRTG
ncbi:hypothetical protein IG631_17592 [Alternaria alternata]|nr:hypothetical protein IG631_17592 [Alternaria alternata]